ncbi:uncharacterized protein [Garra rufa]|uniref:uncharacterized protein n=1 Tax=Garra rufa TaxID=137080 RepID=UPI003CCEC0B2
MKKNTDRDKKVADKCHLCLLGLIILSSLLTVTSGVNDTHVFTSSGESSVHLPCNNGLLDCKSTTWIYNRFIDLSAVELIAGGMKKKDTERLSLWSDCSLNIKNITKEDYGLYTCRQYVNDKLQGTDAGVYLHVLHVSPSSSSQTEISPGSSVTLSCQLDSYAGVSCEDWIHSEGIELFWVNQAGVNLTISDSRYQILFSSGHCIITVSTTLLNVDDNREWRCNVTHRNQLKTSDTYTVKISAPDSAENKANGTAGSLVRVIVILAEFASFTAPTVILLQIICARRAGRKNSQQQRK